MGSQRKGLGEKGMLSYFRSKNLAPGGFGEEVVREDGGHTTPGRWEEADSQHSSWTGKQEVPVSIHGV